MKMLKKANTVFDRVIGVSAFLASIIITYAILAVCLEVVLRYFFNRPQIWVIETAEYSLLFMTFLGAAWVLKNEGHVKVDLVLNQFKPGTQASINIVTSIIGAIVCLILAWYTGQITLDHIQRGVYTTQVLEIRKGYILAVIPVGSFLLFIQFLRRTHNYLMDRSMSRDKTKGT